MNVYSSLTTRLFHLPFTCPTKIAKALPRNWCKMLEALCSEFAVLYWKWTIYKIIEHRKQCYQLKYPFSYSVTDVVKVVNLQVIEISRPIDWTDKEWKTNINTKKSIMVINKCFRPDLNIKILLSKQCYVLFWFSIGGIEHRPNRKINNIYSYRLKD